MERGGYLYPRTLGQISPNCPLPIHVQLIYRWFQGRITRWEVYKYDILTYSHFTCMSALDEGLGVLRLACSPLLISFGLQDPSQVDTPDGSVFKRSVVTSLSEGERSDPSRVLNLCRAPGRPDCFLRWSEDGSLGPERLRRRESSFGCVCFLVVEALQAG